MQLRDSKNRMHGEAPLVLGLMTLNPQPSTPCGDTTGRSTCKLDLSFPGDTNAGSKFKDRLSGNEPLVAGLALAAVVVGIAATLIAIHTFRCFQALVSTII